MIELAEVFRQHGPAYREKFNGRIPVSHLKVMSAIEQAPPNRWDSSPA